jgi:hypothetical protein
MSTTTTRTTREALFIQMERVKAAQEALKRERIALEHMLKAAKS